MVSPPRDLRERLAAVRGMELVLPALEGLQPTFLVGGAVRDLLRDEVPVTDLDLAVQGDARAHAHRLAQRIGGTVVQHERFGTATVRVDQLTIDLAATRRERYPEPGALPVVEAAPVREDLARRDFTVNAMAVGLSGDDLGHLHDPHGGLADLDSGIIRVLHRGSFVDDPTRLLRALRYEARLAAAMDRETEELACIAAAGGALATVSGARIRDELLDLLAETDFPAALRRMGELALDRALHPALEADAALAAAAALGASETGADRTLAALGALVSQAPGPLTSWLHDLHLAAPARDRTVRAAREGPALAELLRPELSNSALHELLRDAPPEALAVALGHGAHPEPVLRYTGTVQHVRLEIDGEDLIAAGIPESPAIGRALRETLRRKLDGEVLGREDELRVALEIARRRP